MAKFSLQPNEVQLLKADHVRHDTGTFATWTDDLILTNKDLICVNKGTFGNIKQVYRYPLDQIFIYGDEPRVVAVNDRSGVPAIEVSFKNGQTEQFSFQTDGKKASKQWINAICKVITGHESQTQTQSFANAFAIPGTEELAATLKGTIDVFKGTFGVKSKQDASVPAAQSSEKVSKKCASCSAPLIGFKGETVQCSYCDTKQVL